MKRKLLLCVCILGALVAVAWACLKTIEKKADSTKLPDERSFVQVSKIDPRYFELSNGKAFIPVGPNICFPRLILDEKLGFENIEMMYKNLAKYGANYSRIYLSAEFFEIENEQQSVFSESQIKRVDRILDLAKEYNLRIKFCFEMFRFLKDSTKRFPGSGVFEKPIYHIDNGGTFTTPDEYFNSEKGKKVYMERVSFIVNRYKDNPYVFGWELWNEFNTVEMSGGNEAMVAWTEDMLTRVHSLDANHLVMQNLGSFDNNSSRAIYHGICTIPNNDVANVHRYIDLGARFQVCHGPMDILTSDAIKELRNFGLNKPILLAETGAVEPYHAEPFKLYPKDSAGIILHDLLFAPFFAGSAGSGQSWHWKEYLECNDLWYMFGRFNNAIKGINPLIENFQPTEFEIPSCRSYMLKGNKTILIWSRDTQSDWRTELIEDRKPSIIESAIKIAELGVSEKDIKSIQVYNPWTDKWSKGKVMDQSIKLPPFTRSVVVKIQLN